MSKQLYRSQTEKKLAGVCGGIAAYFDVDVTLIRLAAVVAFFLIHGVVVLAYIVCALVPPVEPVSSGWQSTPQSAPPQPQPTPSTPAVPITVYPTATVSNSEPQWTSMTPETTPLAETTSEEPVSVSKAEALLAKKPKSESNQDQQ